MITVTFCPVSFFYAEMKLPKHWKVVYIKRLVAVQERGNSTYIIWEYLLFDYECGGRGRDWERKRDSVSISQVWFCFQGQGYNLKGNFIGSLARALGWTPFGLDWVLCSNLGTSSGRGMEYCFPDSERLEFTTVPRGSGTVFMGSPGGVPLNLSFFPFLFLFLFFF